MFCLIFLDLTEYNAHKYFYMSLHQSLTLWIEELGHTQLLLCHIESILQVVSRVGAPQGAIIHQIRPERMEIKCH